MLCKIKFPFYYPIHTFTKIRQDDFIANLKAKPKIIKYNKIVVLR